ncbi:MAG: hypothetical protein COW88_01135 [Candidatus Lloydbacteria bacterium CG22_combo_CG10-13_8_21_14_all_47_15]|uniref:Uncharacterized protein n=1 Tax=Candidatus Lloydbacteria bacterium CG22_combo_CG10-13_8_21_14_all_47_15 TaxID=1974635 RepID=A0A2H0CWC8_9BACT|nr:MAG: hypothetical protein COW88_01135 [Candidatus Lloydbacteria bacterium CG22_combo_CG10-13_8_21_14_all_47_15]
MNAFNTPYMPKIGYQSIRLALMMLVVATISISFLVGFAAYANATSFTSVNYGEDCGSETYSFTIGNYIVEGCVEDPDWYEDHNKNVEEHLEIYAEKAIEQGYTGEVGVAVGCVNALFFNISLPQCSDGIDNDGNGFSDYPNDPGCSSASDNSESGYAPQCSDGIDNDGNGVVDYPDDLGCSSANDNNESGWLPECSDGIDNDGNGLIDYPNDPGCSSASDNSESGYAPQCSDGIDNDGDGFIDYPNDLGCDSALDDTEAGELYTHWNVGAWGVCSGYDSETGQNGTQTRTVESFADEACCNDSEPASSRECSMPPDYDLFDVTGGDPNDITNAFSIYVTFIGDQQVKFSSPVQIGVSPVFANHPNQSDVNFSVTGVSPALPADTEYFFTPQTITPAGYLTGTEFKAKVQRTSAGVYSIGIQAESGGIVKNGTIFLNVSVVNPSFQEI